MCGRMTLEFDMDTVKSMLKEFVKVDHMVVDGYEPSYNIAPTNQLVSVIETKTDRRAGLLRWGLLPPWTKDERAGYKMINARAETIHKKPSYKESFEKRRCIIVASGFYEWREADKQPFHIRHQDQPLMMMAGIWSSFKKEDSTIYTCAVVTTDANKMMRQIHHRMPVLLDKAEVDLWLNQKTDFNSLKEIMKPYSGPIQMRAISKYVNNVRNNGSDCLISI